MTSYQIFLLVVLLAWPLVLAGLLFGMTRVESYIDRSRAATPEEAGLEPVAGAPSEREVRIVFGDEVVGEPGRTRPAESSDGQRVELENERAER